MNTTQLIEQYNQGAYPARHISCPRHGLQSVTDQSHEQAGTTYRDGSHDTRWHTVAACGCTFDVFYSHVSGEHADTVTVFDDDVRPLVFDEAPCAWCSELAPLREWTHEGGEVEDLCPRCYRAAEKQRARERGV
jgi:hypothetical protein